MTWGEFKKYIEQNEVSDTTEVWSIDIAGIRDVYNISVTIDPNDKSVSIWG